MGWFPSADSISIIRCRPCLSLVSAERGTSNKQVKHLPFESHLVHMSTLTKWRIGEDVSVARLSFGIAHGSLDFSVRYALLAHSATWNLLVFSQLRTLGQKHRGWGGVRSTEKSEFDRRSQWHRHSCMCSRLPSTPATGWAHDRKTGLLQMRIAGKMGSA